jgi:hypothetical protein
LTIDKIFVGLRPEAPIKLKGFKGVCGTAFMTIPSVQNE